MQKRGMIVAALCLAAFPAMAFTEDFDDVSSLAARGWVMTNNSSPAGPGLWMQGEPAMFYSQSGNVESYVASDYTAVADAGTLSNWLITPVMTFHNGDVVSFYTGRVDTSFVDRLQLRMSTSGDSTDVGTAAQDVGTFSRLLLDINPTYTYDGYPAVQYPDMNIAARYAVTISGLTAPVNGRLALRHFVEGVSSTGRGDYIGIDSFEVTGYLTALPGDVDGNGQVDFADFLVLEANYGMPGARSQGDLDGSGTVDFADYLLLEVSYGSNAVSVPEPAALALLATGAMAMLTLRRRRV